MSRAASLVTQLGKNLPAMRKTRVRSLGREDPLGKEMATHSSILAWETPCMGRGAIVPGVTRAGTLLSDYTTTTAMSCTQHSYWPHEVMGVEHQHALWGELFFCITIYLGVVLGLCCCTGFSLVVEIGGYSLRICELLVEVVSPLPQHGL